MSCAMGGRVQTQLENLSLKLKNTLPRFLTHEGAALRSRGSPEISHRAEASPELFSASCQASAGPSRGPAPQAHRDPHPAGFLPACSRLGSVSPLLVICFHARSSYQLHTVIIPLFPNSSGHGCSVVRVTWVGSADVGFGP